MKRSLARSCCSGHLATFFGGLIGLAYMLVIGIIDRLRGQIYERDDDR